MADPFKGFDPNAGSEGPIRAPGGIQGGVLRTGVPEVDPYKWRCPVCNNEWTTPLEQGCPRCAEQAALAGPAHQNVPEPALRPAVLKYPESVHAAGSIRAQGLTLKARRSLMRALALYSETAALHHDELSRQEALSWARLLNQADADDEAAALRARKAQETPHD